MAVQVMKGTTRDNDRPAGKRHPTPYEASRALVASILEAVAEDVKGGCQASAQYLETPIFCHYCELLDLDPVAARARLLAQMPKVTPLGVSAEERRGKYKSDAFYREVHRVYEAEKLTVAQAAKRYGVIRATLAARWALMGLPIQDRRQSHKEMMG